MTSILLHIIDTIVYPTVMNYLSGKTTLLQPNATESS